MSLKTVLVILSFVLAAGMLITLLVFWNIYIIGDYHTIRELGRNVPATGRWTVLTLGIVFFSFLLVILTVFFVNLIRSARFKQQQKDFVNMMTHELKMPMSSIQVFAQTLRHRPVTAQEREKFVGCILDECERMNFLVHQLLKSQQIEKGDMPIKPIRMEAAAVAREFVESWPRPIEINVSDAGLARMDPVLVEFALANLVSNAEKYGNGAPLLLVGAENGHAFISVRDRSAPIPRKYHKKIFRKFFRIPNRATREQSGVGLGLSIVKTIMKAHKGQVRLETADSPPGNQFTLVFPSAA